jgi:putative Mg2+ transporter-C (MgtC) family protein
VLTGVGFLGAGVIIRSEKGHHVRGLTTAACVWVTACIGAACAIAQWQIVVMDIVLVLVILVVGDPFERPALASSALSLFVIEPRARVMH